MINRRKFISRLASTAAAGLVLPKLSFAFPQQKTIGIQLYSLRALVEKDLTGTLRMLSHIGYNAIEAAGYKDRSFYGYAPAEFKALCTDLGLMPVSTHTMLGGNETGYAIEDAIRAGMSYIVIPSIPSEKRRTASDYARLANEFNELGEKCKNLGIRMGYHNHAFEFKPTDGMIPYNILLQATDPQLCFMQADFFWMAYAGVDPLDYLKKYPGRFELWHVKDMKDKESGKSTEIGKGIIDFPAIFKKRDLAGMKYYFVEQEEFEIDPEESVAISYAYLKSIDK